ncbi:MAG: trypsin-like peptidase domain-containing protein, partial [Eubacteriales bacterium]
MSENENNQDLNQTIGSTPDDSTGTGTTDKPGDTVNENVNSFNNVPSGSEGEQPAPVTQAQTPPFTPQYPPYMGQYQYPQQRPQPPTYYNNPTQPYYVPPQYAASAQFGHVPPPPTKGKKKGVKIFFAVLSVLVVFSIILSGVAIAMGNNKLPVKGADGTTSTTSDGPELNINNTPTDSSNSSGKTGVLTPVEIAQKVKPSVVGILTFSGQNSSATGEGSGIVLGTDATGKFTYIITCAHVISDAGVSISIQLENGTQYKAILVGYDVRTDVGVVKIKKT